MNAIAYKGAVETAIATVLEDEVAAAPSNEVCLLLDRIKLVILRNGKRSRPELLRLAYEAYGGKQPRKLVGLGAALELHHQFLLVHDDIIDKDFTRYDQPNILGYYRKDAAKSPHDIPIAMALLAGNLLFTQACQLIKTDNWLGDKQKLALLGQLLDANVGVHYGQQLDIHNVMPGLSEISEERLALTASLKTALYSVQLPLKWAAELLDLKLAERRKLDNFGQHFGILYQMLDDYADYFPNKTAFANRPKYRDFRLGKITYPLYCALAHASPTQLAFLNKHFGQAVASDATLEKVVGILEACGAREASEKQLEGYHVWVQLALQRLSMPEKAKHEFAAMLDKHRL